MLCLHNKKPLLRFFCLYKILFSLFCLINSISLASVFCLSLLYKIDKIVYYFNVKDNKTKVVISCLSILALSIIILLVYFVFIDNKSSNNNYLTCFVYDKTINVGESIYNFYDINDNTAEISFEVDKENIIEIDKFHIKGLNVGEVNITLIAKTKDEKIEKEFKVNVVKKEYTFEFTSIYGCNIQQDNIFTENGQFQFNLIVKDENNTLLEDVDFDIYSDKTSTIIDKSFSSILIIAQENCTLTFVFNDFSITLTKNVIIN